MSSSPPRSGHEHAVRQLLSGDARHVAPLLLGAVLTHDSPEGAVSVRITEVEAYIGPHDSPHPDPGSHTFRGPTGRNKPMFGPAGHLYVYFTYGMHYCANIVCGPPGVASALLLRGGEIVGGEELARSRRPASKSAQGPGQRTCAAGHGTGADDGGQRPGRPRGTLPAGLAGGAGTRRQYRSAGGGIGCRRQPRLSVAVLADR